MTEAAGPIEARDGTEAAVGRGTEPSDVADRLDEPVARVLRLSCSREHAFDAFIKHIGEWWPRAFSNSGDRLANVVVEAEVDGLVYEVNTDGEETPWAAVTRVRTGKSITLSWTLGVRAPGPTKLEFDFTDDGPGAVVTVHHSGFTSLDDRGRFDHELGWDLVLAAYQAYADPAQSDLPPAQAPA
ncbi:MAG TPA: SRPBCC domain-containing protein [Micromonosporaceae bacterium]|jgi:hypothetical protein